MYNEALIKTYINYHVEPFLEDREFIVVTKENLELFMAALIVIKIRFNYV